MGRPIKSISGNEYKIEEYVEHWWDFILYGENGLFGFIFITIWIVMIIGIILFFSILMIKEGI